MSFESSNLQPQKPTANAVNVEKIHSENRSEQPRVEVKDAKEAPNTGVVEIGKIEPEQRTEAQKPTEKPVEVDLASLLSDRLKNVHPAALELFLSAYKDSTCPTTQKTIALWTGQTTLEELLS
ncbi:MAG TPA: hypothetical protein V6C97_02815 [Oculatellaceae cyanobacterium]